MSGVEFIVSTVLAGVPIALGAYDRSERAFSVFKHYPREAHTLQVRLGSQRAIFRNNAINLLTVITKDRAAVQEVMKQPSSQNSTQRLVLSPAYDSTRQLDALDESLVACCQTAQRINYTLLQRMCSQAEEFQFDIDQKQTTASEWLRHVRSRFKLSLNKPRIEEGVAELREFNRDFCLITEQIIKTLQRPLDNEKDEPPIRKSARYLNTLQRYHRVRFASTVLYSTLQVRWMCPSHPCHLFDLRILDGDVKSGKRCPEQHVTCELAITNEDPSYAAADTLRLEIEQVCEANDDEYKDAEDTSNLQHLAAVLESNADRFKLSAPTKKGGTRKRIRVDEHTGETTSQDITSTSTTVHLDSHPTSPTTVSGSVMGLGLVEDFCKTFHDAPIRMNCLGRPLLGILEGAHSQRFYLPPSPPPLGTSRSLSDIISWIAEEPVLRSLPRPLLVDLAGGMAEGIMQFYSTPWLTQANLGQNVRFLYPSDLSAKSVELEGPYFMARVEMRSKGKGKIKSIDSLNQMSTDARVNFSGARIELLFGFGILLLEIGFRKPWTMLKQSVSKSATAGLFSDYKAAEMLAQLLVNQMGLTYPKIIRKCLGCDFGLGETDLDNEGLQRRFLEEVVTGLQQLREHMREMNSYPLG